MVTTTLSQRVDAPFLQPPAISLVRSALLPPTGPGDRDWGLGIRYRPEADVGVTIDEYCSASAGTFDYAMPAEAEWLPYAVIAFDRCSLLSSQAHDYVGRATRLIEAATPKVVESEFWSGTLSQAKGWGNLYLADSSGTNLTDAGTGAAVSIYRAMAILEQALADCGFGAQGMIHCAREALPGLLAFGHGLRRDGNLLRTQYDTIVVPGVGYPGTEPDGATGAQVLGAGETYLYATGLVEYRQTSPTLFPDWPQGALGAVPAQAIDKTTNTVRLFAVRTALASWDGQCHFAVRATLPT